MARITSRIVPWAIRSISRSIFRVRRGDALHRRDYAAQYVIESTILAGIFDREYVGDLFYDADGRMVAFPVGADRTDFFIREVIAQFAVFDVAAESVDAACHVAYRIGFHAQQVDRQAQRRAASDAWEFRQFSGHVLKQSGHVLGNFWIRRGGSGFFRWFRTSSTPSSPFCRRRW